MISVVLSVMGEPDPDFMSTERGEIVSRAIPLTSILSGLDTTLVLSSMVALRAIGLVLIVVVDKLVRLSAIAAGVFVLCLMQGSVGWDGFDLRIGTW